MTLDAADEKSATVAADIGGKVDILVNTTEYVRPGGLLDRRGTSIARDEIDQRYLGFINLAQAFRPAMRMRGADGINTQCGLGQHSLGLCAGELACLWRLLGLASRVPVALALPPRRAQARRRQGV